MKLPHVIEVIAHCDEPVCNYHPILQLLSALRLQLVCDLTGSVYRSSIIVSCRNSSKKPDVLNYRHT